MFTGWDRPTHWLVLALVVVVLFGYKKLPDMSRSLGRSLRIFKTEMKGMTEDDEARDSSSKSANGSVEAPDSQSNATVERPDTQSSADAAQRQPAPTPPSSQPPQPPVAD
jgi:sec-independent protein translocase protein TatA